MSRSGGFGALAGVAALWVPPLLWGSLIFYLSSVPNPRFPLPRFQYQDKLGHTLFFGIQALLLARALAPSVRWRGALVLSFLLTLLFGIVDEMHQARIPGRFSDPWDVVADGVGAAAGLWLRARPGSRPEGDRRGSPVREGRR